MVGRLLVGRTRIHSGSVAESGRMHHAVNVASKITLVQIQSDPLCIFKVVYDLFK